MIFRRTLGSMSTTHVSFKMVLPSTQQMFLKERLPFLFTKLTSLLFKFHGLLLTSLQLFHLRAAF